MKKVLLGLVALSAVAMGADATINVETIASVTQSSIKIDYGTNGDIVTLDHDELSTKTGASNVTAPAIVRVGRADGDNLVAFPSVAVLDFTLVSASNDLTNGAGGEIAHTLTAQIGMLDADTGHLGTEQPKISISGDTLSAAHNSVNVGGGIMGVRFSSGISEVERKAAPSGSYSNSSTLNITIRTM